MESKEITFRYIGPMIRRCSLRGCERQAEFLDQRRYTYCRLHVQYLMVSRQLVEDAEEQQIKESFDE